MGNASEARIKGVAFRELIGWEEERGGDVHAVVGDLPADLGRHFDVERDYLGVLPSTWYPAPVVHALLDGLTAGMSVSERDRWATEGARHVMTVTLRGIYRRLIEMLVSPKMYARFADKMWRSYYDSGDFRVVISDPTTADCTVGDWAAHHDVICAMNREAATAIYGAMGLENVHTERTECVSHGDPVCRFITKWAAAPRRF